MRQHILSLLDDLAADERGRITTAEARDKLQISTQSASNLMSRLVSDGFLDRVARGVFVLRPLGQLGTRAAAEDIALAVGAAFSGEPHRLAFRSALDHHGLLAHPARTLQVALPRRVKLEHLSGRRLRSIHEPLKTVTIGAEDAGHGAVVSTVERAFLECASRPALAGGWIALATALNCAPVDPEKLTRLAGELDAGAALRRLGSIVEVHGHDELWRGMRPAGSDTRVIALDPQAPLEEPWTDRRWRVRWPVAAHDAREIVAA